MCLGNRTGRGSFAAAGSFPPGARRCRIVKWTRMFPADAHPPRAPSPPLSESSVIVLALLALQTGASEPKTSYWQQEVAYQISARLDEPRGVLAGNELVRYTNRS